MSSFGAIYSGTSGLVAFSKGLDVVSNNVSNMNTAGFKRSELAFRDLFYSNEFSGGDGWRSYSPNGNGVGVGSATVSYMQGDISQSGRSTDAAIDGLGFFVLQKDGATYYTRAGLFELDSNDRLVTSGDFHVMGHQSGALTPMSFAEMRVKPATPTSLVQFRGNLSSTDDEHTIEAIRVYDASGTEHILDLTLTKNTSSVAGSWLAEVKTENGVTLLSGEEIRFRPNGSPATGFNSFDLTLHSGASDTARFHFGDPGSFSGTTSFSGGTNSTVSVASQDGQPAGTLTSIQFSEEGVATVTYSNGQVESGPALALAWTDRPDALEQLGNGLFKLNGVAPTIGTANTGALGRIIGGSIEGSNVEISQEFSDLIIVQRGFQVSSQVVTIANEMMQQLLEAAGKA